jgi:hypothetical protein
MVKQDMVIEVAPHEGAHPDGVPNVLHEATSCATVCIDILPPCREYETV